MATLISINALVDNPQTSNRNNDLAGDESDVIISDYAYDKAMHVLVRKLDRRLIPLLTLLELNSFLNRINIGRRPIFLIR
jgi:hypothetical protein